MPTVKPVPDQYHTINVTLTVHNATEAIAWYKKALGAKEVMPACMDDHGKVMHAELQIGDSIFMLNDEFPDMNCRSAKSYGGSPASIFMYVQDADKCFELAVKEGAKVTMPLNNMFWGDRYGQIQDPYGHKWGIATHVEDVAPEEMKKRQKEWQAKQPAMAKK